MSLKLDKEEKEILQSYEDDEWVSVSNAAEVSKYKAAANTGQSH